MSVPNRKENEADNPAGGIASAWTRTSNGGFQGQFSGATARVLRRFDDQGHEWSNEVRFDRNSFEFGFDTIVDQTVPPQPIVYEAIANQNDQDMLGVTSAYVRPFSDGGRLRLGYDGAGFAGWARQPRLRTVQGTLERALSNLTSEPIRVAMAGRTDAGVHAKGQVASFRTRSRHRRTTTPGAMTAPSP